MGFFGVLTQQSWITLDHWGVIPKKHLRRLSLSFKWGVVKKWRLFFSFTHNLEFHPSVSELWLEMERWVCFTRHRINLFMVKLLTLISRSFLICIWKERKLSYEEEKISWPYRKENFLAPLCSYRIWRLSATFGQFGLWALFLADEEEGRSKSGTKMMGS